MQDTVQSRIRMGRFAIVLAGTLAAAAIAYLTWNVAREIRAQGSADTDNVQWSLFQSEVEFQEFYARLRLGEDLSSIRRRFDVFYSRIKTISEAQVFAQLRTNADFAARLDHMNSFLDQAVALIDGDDVSLTEGLPRLAIQAQDVRADIRGLSHAGLTLFADLADVQRNAVARTLTQLAIALICLITALGLGVAFLVRLNRKVSQRGRQQLRSAARMNTIMNTSLDGVIVSDAAGRITGFSNAAEAIFGYCAADVMGKEIGQVIVPDHLRAAHDKGMERMRHRGEKRVVGKGRVQLEACRADGSVFPVELAVQSATTDEGEIFIAFLRDVSQRVADEAELIEARDKAIAGEKSRSDFLATMSHEIRTPLNGLIGNMTLLRDTALTDTQDTYLRNMETSGRLLMSHVSDVLDIARYDSGKIFARPRPINISALIQDIIDNQGGMARSKNTTLGWGWSGPAQDWINADPDRLQHILINLIGNAVKFTKNGRVFVTATWDPEGAIHIDIADTGIGIEESLKDKIFDDFVTGNTAYDRDVGGTGLGLSIVKRFVEALDGSISVQSEFGVGSTFSVRLPTQPAEPVTEQTGLPATPTPALAKPLRVLVVEDNEINRFVVRNMLTADGHVVTEANDGQEGVDCANADVYDLILMDISMPVLDGRTATRHIRDGNGPSAQAQIYALTANALAEERADFLAHRMDGVLTKPLTKSALLSVLRDVASPPSHANSDVIDLSHHNETRLFMGPDAYPGMVAQFQSEIDELMDWLSTDHSDAEIAKRAHKLAGNAALFGANALRDTLIKLENAATAGAGDQIAALITQLGFMQSDVQHALTALADVKTA